MPLRFVVEPTHDGWTRTVRRVAMDTSRERLRPTVPPQEALLASLQDGFEVLDADGTIVDVNERFAEIVGRPREEIIGLRPPFPWWSELDAARIQEAMRSVLAGGSGEFDFTFCRPDGALVNVILNATHVQDDSGELSVVATLKDVSERAAAQAEREELVRNLSAERAHLSRVLERMGRIQRFTASIAAETTEGEVVGSLVSAAQEAIGASSAAVVLLSGDDRLTIVTQHGEPDPEMVPASSSPDGDGDLQEAFRSGSSLWLEPRPGPEGPDERWGFVPIVRPGGVMGVLVVCCPEDAFTFDDRDTLETMVRQAAQVLERAHLYAAESRTRITLGRVLAVTDAALEWMESDDALQALLRRIREAVDADSASLLVRQDDHLRVRATDGLRRVPGEQPPVPIGQGFAGRIAATRQPLVAEDLSRIEVVSPWLRQKLRSVAGVPIIRGKGVIGVLHVGSRSRRHFDREELDLLNLVATRLATALDRAELYEATRAARADASRAADRLRRLQAATAALTGAKGVREVSESILREAIAAMRADAGVLAIPSDDGRWLDVMSTMGRRSFDVGFAGRLDVEANASICEAYRSGRPVWVATRAEWERRFPEGLGSTKPWARSILALPMMINEERLGAIGLLFKTEGRLGRDERRLAKTFAEQAALALERAQLYEVEHAVAATLQRSLLPRSLPEERRVTVATRYRPGMQELDVGGDWYDVIHVAADRIGVAVGDVVGHGLEAASAMGQLRSALRSLALSGDGPAAVIGGLDRFARTTDPATVATVVYAELDLVAGMVRYACAGHPPPLVVIGRRVQELMDGRTTPLAALPEAPSCDEGVQPFPPGSLMLLYSDGLIERRGEPLDVGMDRLRSLLTELPSEDPEELADGLLGALTGDVPQDDDVALLCLRNVAQAGPLAISVPVDPAALAGLRTAVHAWLSAEAVFVDLHDDVVLACDEACANAIEHAYERAPGGSIDVELRHEDDEVVITVTDSGEWRDDAVEGGRGRGIAIMRAIMDEVDIQTDGAGTVVTLRRRAPERIGSPQT
jgi:PAS domain S-box-containing protein